MDNYPKQNNCKQDIHLQLSRKEQKSARAVCYASQLAGGPQLVGSPREPASVQLGIDCGGKPEVPGASTANRRAKSSFKQFHEIPYNEIIITSVQLHFLSLNEPWKTQSEGK
jgi:hypothetical protein